MLRNLFFISILIFNLKLIAQTPPVINSHITSGLLLHLNAGNSSSYSGSGYTWSDLSSSGNNGTINGATFNSTNKSFDFDGTNDYIGLSAVLPQGQAVYTIEGYFKQDTQQTGVIFEQSGNNGTNNGARMMALSDGYGGFNGRANDFHDNTPVKIGDWNYWTITVDKNAGSNQIKVYVNGILQSQGNTSNGANNLNVGTGSTNIGSQRGVSEFFDGEIKTIKVYNRVLSAAEVKQNYWATVNPYVVTDGLVLLLDSDNLNSYDGNGTVWRDISGNNYDFNINASGFRTIGGIKHMDVEGSYGAPIRINNNGGYNVPTYQNATAQVFSTILNSTATWRTLLRGYVNDHPVLIRGGNGSDANSLGYYENGGANFVDSGFDVNSIPNYTTQFNFLNFHFANSSPFWEFSYNTEAIQAQITSSSASYQNGFYVLGKSDGGPNHDVAHGGQWWGKIGIFLYYNRKLTEAEKLQNYNAFAPRYNLPSSNSAPTDITLSASAFNENLPSGTQVASLTATDSDNGDSHTFTLASGNGTNDADNNYFTIQGASLKTSGTFDFETKSSYNIYINVNDGIANYAKAFTVTVSDVNEAPDDIKFGKNIFKDGLLLHLDSGSPDSFSGSGNTWNDLSGNSYNGTLMNSPSFSNDNGGMINLNGSTQWVQLNSFAGVLSNSSSYTISIWFKSTETNASGQVYNNSIFSMHDSSGGNIFRIGAAPDASKGIYYNFGVGAPEGRASSGTNLHDNQWHNVFISKNTGSQAQFYLDNNLVSTNNSNTDGTPFNNVGKVSIGQEFDNASTSDHFQGSIPVVIVYNNVLTQNERTELYNSYKKRYMDGGGIQFSSSVATITIDEGSSVGSLVGTLSATGKDAGETLTYSLVSNGQSSSQHNSSFTVSGTQILTAAAIDYETTSTLNLNIQVSDGTSTYQEAFTVYVNDVNDNASTDLAVSTSTFAESVTSGTAVASITTTDPDSSAVNSFTYSLISGNGTNDGDNSSFTISGPSLVTSGTFNYETKSLLKVYLQVNDGVASYAKALTLTVSDVNETPTDISLTSTRVVENVTVGTQVGTLSTTDPDSGNTFTYSLVSSNDARDDDNGSFTVSGTSLVTSGTIDYETKSSMNIYVNVNDGVNDYPKAFTISVSDTLEPITDVGFVEPSIVTNGLVLHLDAGNSNSYSGSGNTWNDLSGNSNHFDINNVATHNNDGYFLFNNTLVGGTGMIGPASNSFGLSQTNHTIELVMTATAARGSIINFRGDSHDYAINVHVPWSNNNIYYENIGHTQLNYLEIEGELKISTKDLFKKNNEWYNNY